LDLKRIKTSILTGLFLCISPLWTDTTIPLTNPSFEEGTFDWTAAPSDTAAKLSTIIPETARTGKFNLRVSLADGGPGSWFQSTRTPVEKGKSCHLEFWTRRLKTRGVDIWVHLASPGAVRSHDSFASDPGSVLNHVLPRVRSGSIVLLHEGPRLNPSVRVTAIDRLLDTLTDRCLRCVIHTDAQLR
jgi:hypothetical protein